MGATFTTTGSWQGEAVGGFQTAKKVAGLPNPADGYLWKRKRNVSKRWRWGKGLTAFTDSSGDNIAGDDLTVTNGDDTTLLAGQNAHIITQNNVVASPPGSGIWKENMVAEGYTDWEQWEIPTA